MEKKKPVHEIRLGKVRAAIWENEIEGGGIRYSVTFSKLYKEGEQWRDSSSFGRQELLLLAKVADTVHTLLYRELEVSDD
jgi:hypothetical protein